MTIESRTYNELLTFTAAKEIRSVGVWLLCLFPWQKLSFLIFSSICTYQPYYNPPPSNHYRVLHVITIDQLHLLQGNNEGFLS